MSATPSMSQVKKMGKQSFFHMIMALIALVLLTGGIFLGVTQIPPIHNKIATLQELQPGHRFDEFSDKIDKIRKKVEKDYGGHAMRMQDEIIISTYTNFSNMYLAASESESAYLEMLIQYQKTSYQQAKNVRGSGEWYEFYDGHLSDYITNAQTRVNQLNSYRPIE